MPLLRVKDVSALDALRRYATAQGLRGKDIIDVVRKAMKYWVSFSIAKIPKGDPQKIRAHLTQIVSTYSKLSARNARNANRTSDKWRGTLAVQLVFKLNWQDARLAGAFGDIEGSYRKAALFTSRRVFAAGLHRSGLREAVLKLRAGSGAGRLPKFKNQPGAYAEKLADNVTSILVESWAKAAGSHAKDPTQLYPNAFTQALPEVERLIAGFLEKDMKTAAAKQGFTVS